MINLTVHPVASKIASSGSALTSAIGTLQGFTSALSQYVVTPLNAFGLGGFVFDVEGDATAQLSADITDHYTETNEAIQDHIAIRPKRFTLKNYVGELVDRQDDSTNTNIQQLTQKLTVVTGYLPALTSGLTQAKAALDNGNALNPKTLANSVNQIADYWALAKNLLSTQTRQQQAYQYFKSLMEQKILFSLQTPFEFVSNMAIETIMAVQSENSKYITDFSITLKQIRFASTSTTAYNPTDYAGDASLQAQPGDLVGPVQGQPVSTTSLTGGTDYSNAALSQVGIGASTSPLASLDSVKLAQNFVNNYSSEGSAALSAGKASPTEISQALRELSYTNLQNSSFLATVGR